MERGTPSSLYSPACPHRHYADPSKLSRLLDRHSPLPHCPSLGVWGSRSHEPCSSSRRQPELPQQNSSNGGPQMNPISWTIAQRTTTHEAGKRPRWQGVQLLLLGSMRRPREATVSTAWRAGASPGHPLISSAAISPDLEGEPGRRLRIASPGRPRLAELDARRGYPFAAHLRVAFQGVSVLDSRTDAEGPEASEVRRGGNLREVLRRAEQQTYMVVQLCSPLCFKYTASAGISGLRHPPSAMPSKSSVCSPSGAWWPADSCAMFLLSGRLFATASS